MSNLHDLFQDTYDKNKETFFILLKLACEENTTINLSLSPDGIVVFSFSNDEIVKTITQDEHSIKYTQYHEFAKKGDGK